MGEWLEPKKPEHVCVRPSLYSLGHSVGDRWRCDCGVVYVVGEESQHGESWRQWRREKNDGD